MRVPRRYSPQSLPSPFTHNACFVSHRQSTGLTMATSRPSATGRPSPRLHMLTSAPRFCESSLIDYQGTKMRQNAGQRYIPGASGLQGAPANIFGGDAARGHCSPWLPIQAWRVPLGLTKTWTDLPEAQASKRIKTITRQSTLRREEGFVPAATTVHHRGGAPATTATVAIADGLAGRPRSSIRPSRR